MIVKLTPASDDGRVWMVSTAPDAKHAVPVDFMTVPDRQRSLLGPDSGYFEAEPGLEGWEIKRRIGRQPW